MFQAGPATHAAVYRLFARCPLSLDEGVSQVYWWGRGLSGAFRALQPVDNLSHKCQVLNQIFILCCPFSPGQICFFLSLKHLKTSFFFCPTKNLFSVLCALWCEGVLLMIHQMGEKKIGYLKCFVFSWENCLCNISYL